MIVKFNSVVTLFVFNLHHKRRSRLKGWCDWGAKFVLLAVNRCIITDKKRQGLLILFSYAVKKHIGNPFSFKISQTDNNLWKLLYEKMFSFHTCMWFIYDYESCGWKCIWTLHFSYICIFIQFSYTVFLRIIASLSNSSHTCTWKFVTVGYGFR